MYFNQRLEGGQKKWPQTSCLSSPLLKPQRDLIVLLSTDFNICGAKNDEAVERTGPEENKTAVFKVSFF